MIFTTDLNTHWTDSSSCYHCTAA